MSKFDWSTPNQRYIEEIAYSRSVEEARKVLNLPVSLPESATISALLAELAVAYAPRFNIKSFGNSSTGTGTGNDSKAILAAAAAAEATPNGVIVADEGGIFTFDQPLPTKRSVIGGGLGARFRPLSGSVSGFQPQTGDGILLSNFTMEGIDPTGGGSAVAIFTKYDSAPTGLIIDRVFINGVAAGQGFASGIDLENTQNAVIMRTRTRRIRGTAASNSLMLRTRVVDGASIASANALVIPAAGNSFRVTGTTQINSISDSLTSETVITLAFAAGVVVQNSGNLQLLAGTNYTATAEVQANYPHDFILLQKVSAGVWKQVPFHPLACNYNTAYLNDFEFETGPTDPEKQGYAGIAMRGGGSFNNFIATRVKGGTGAQLSFVSTTTFADALRHNRTTDSVLIGCDGKIVSANGYQEAAIEWGGRCLDNTSDGDRIYDANRWGVLINEDGTYLSNYRTKILNVKVWRAQREGIIDLGSQNSTIDNCEEIDCGLEAANTYDGVQLLCQGVAGAEANGSKVTRNTANGTRHRYGVNNKSNSGSKSRGVLLKDNVSVGHQTAPYNDEGLGTIYQIQLGPPLGPFSRSIPAGYKTVADNTAAGFVRITIPNKTCQFDVEIRYSLNSNQNLRARSGRLRVTGGRFTGQNAAVSAAPFGDTGQEVALPGGAEAFTSVTWAAAAVSGGAGATQTIDLTFKLDSDSNLASNLHFEASVFSDNAVSADLGSEVTIAAL